MGVWLTTTTWTTPPANNNTATTAPAVDDRNNNENGNTNHINNKNDDGVMMMQSVVSRRTSGGAALILQQRSITNASSHNKNNYDMSSSRPGQRPPLPSPIANCFRTLFVLMALTFCLSLGNLLAIFQEAAALQGRHLRVSTTTDKSAPPPQNNNNMVVSVTEQQQQQQQQDQPAADQHQSVTVAEDQSPPTPADFAGTNNNDNNDLLLLAAADHDSENKLEVGGDEAGDSEEHKTGGGDPVSSGTTANIDDTTPLSTEHVINIHQHGSENNQIKFCETTRTEISIRSYVSLMEFPEDWLLLIWNADGSFDRTHAQNVTHYDNWRPVDSLLTDAPPSPHGRVALLLNSDRLAMSNQWYVRPPVPVWLYSKPTGSHDPRTLDVSKDNDHQRCELDGVSMVPTHYDSGDWNLACINHVNNHVTRHNFADKINKVVWRGAIHSAEVEKSRVALFEYIERHANGDTHAVEGWLDVMVVGGKNEPGFLDVDGLAEYRYQLDLGGLSGTAWGGLRWKLCTGLLVFRVESWANDWWYDTLTPWTHYIPVKADVSDLREMYQWTQDHPDEAAAIAAAGKEKCLETAGSEAARDYYQKAITALPEAALSTIEEAVTLIDEMNAAHKGMEGIVVPEIAASASGLQHHPDATHTA